ncbi:MAG: hypothetical protein CSA95_00040 [Bacteroidetes bacterium]|nr:MAG: hypothetical protein CSA95_00040 [Bacteroidota bacterium]
MKKIVFLFSFFFLTILCLPGSIFSQEPAGYLVVFTDKDGVDFDPFTYFSPKAIERRILQNIPLDDITDYPVREDYVAWVTAQVEAVDGPSRWFNALAVSATQAQIASLRALDFVKEVIPLRYELSVCEKRGSMPSKRSLEILKRQTNRMGIEAFRKAGIDGKGVRVAVFDAGFPNVDEHPAFAHLRDEHRILETYDFIKKRPFVYKANSHGTSCLSCIAGMYNDTPIGLATGAEFLLARTEKTFEPYREEYAWLAAAEWADKNGADIISSSLGYTYHRYFPEDMDGTSVVARAANMAARKGILVVNAMGNDGSQASWKYVGTPADADSVLSIGGIDPFTDYHIAFSSYGPTANGVRKPNVVAFGHAFLAGKKGFQEASGTSFATPLVAGFAACAKQYYPEIPVMELFEKIQEAADLYPYFDYAHGYGVPQAALLLGEEKRVHTPTFEFVDSQEELSVKILPVKRRFAYPNSNYLYYQFLDAEGKILEYAVVEIYSEVPLQLQIADLAENIASVKVFYNGYVHKEMINR